VVVDTPPGDERIVRAALARADALVIPTRAGGVEPNRVVATLEMTPANIPAGVVICSARLGTRDLEATVEWWAELEVPVWGIIPERVSIASGPPPASRPRVSISTARCSRRRWASGADPQVGLAQGCISSRCMGLSSHGTGGPPT
jgi:hypothetical protein